MDRVLQERVGDRLSAQETVTLHIEARLEAQDKQLNERRSLADAARDEAVEAVRDEVCTQTFALEHQQQRIAVFEAKVAGLDAKFDETLDTTKWLLRDFENRVTAELAENQKYLASQLKEMQSQVKQNVSDTQQAVSRLDGLAQEQEDDR